MSHGFAQLVFGDEEESVSRLYLIKEMTGILMDYTGEPAHKQCPS